VLFHVISQQSIPDIAPLATSNIPKHNQPPMLLNVNVMVMLLSVGEGGYQENDT
jgi:hypothetical protein